MNWNDSKNTWVQFESDCIFQDGFKILKNQIFIGVMK